MDEINDKQWKAFEELAAKYPDDHGVRLTADLARWFKEAHERFLKQQEHPEDGD